MLILLPDLTLLPVILKTDLVLQLLFIKLPHNAFMGAGLQQA